MGLKLETQNLSKSFGDCHAVTDVSLSFESGLIHAVLGENGAGKSTLMKLLFGLLQPSYGRILINGSEVRWRDSMDAIQRGLGMVQQHFSLVENLSAIDNVMLGAEVCGWGGRLNRKSAIAKLEEKLPSPSLRVPWDAKISELTVGQKQRVEILKLLFRDSEVLFLDEPTAVLTPLEIEDFFDVLRKLKAAGKTIVLITHKLNEVLQVCDTYTVLRQGRQITRGEVANVTTSELVESMIGRKILDFEFDRVPTSQDNVLECKDLKENSFVRGAMKGLTMHVRKSEVVGIAGVEGSGQRNLVEAIMGLRSFQGEIEILSETLLGRSTSHAKTTAKVRELGTGLVPEDRQTQGLWLDQSVFDNMIIGLERDFIENFVFRFDRIKAETSVWARDFDVRAPSFENPIGSLSGGNQQKVIFAREVSGRKPKFLICHQPTRGIDLGAIDLIHRRILELRNQGLGVLILSSELDELLKLCDRLYVFFEGRITAHFERKDFDRMRVGAAMTGVVP